MSNFQPLGAEILCAMDALYDYCVYHQVTDLHFEPTQQSMQLKCRIGKWLQNYSDLDPKQLKPITQRFKILAHLDISDLSLPQDGQFIWYDMHKFNPIPCRISTCPTLYGEKLVIRLLSFYKLQYDWKHLGLSTQQQSCIERQLTKEDGIILVCGATGSGKTTTLYSLLSYLNDGRKNIVSIEDPIEIPFLGFTQIELHPQKGFGMQECLRTVLRQDPDLIMIGEIRDKESAMLLLQGAQTGHLMLSTIHAASALGCLQRLAYLGLNIYDVLDYLRLIIFQQNISHIQFDIMELTQEFKQLVLNQFNRVYS